MVQELLLKARRWLIKPPQGVEGGGEIMKSGCNSLKKICLSLLEREFAKI